MDLSQFNPQRAADAASRVVLTSPFDGEPIKDENGKTMAAHIVGMQSTVAKNMDAKHRRESPRPDRAVDDMTPDEQQAYLEELQAFGRKAGAEKLAAMITKLEGKWESVGRALKAGDVDALAELVGAEDWLADQLIARAKDIEHYQPKM